MLRGGVAIYRGGQPIGEYRQPVGQTSHSFRHNSGAQDRDSNEQAVEKFLGRAVVTLLKSRLGRFGAKVDNALSERPRGRGRNNIDRGVSIESPLMATATISIEVDADSARIFAAATAEERRKLEILLGLRLRELTATAARPLKIVMDEIGARAEARGLTPEIVEALLHGN